MTLKDSLFNQETVSTLANLIKDVHPSFRSDEFVSECVKTFPPLELKERMSSVREQLNIYMPSNYIETVELLRLALSNRTQGAFVFGSVLEYIEVYGCTDEYVDYSLEKLGELTGVLSSEFAIRPFFNKYPVKTLEIFEKWSKSEDFEIRRLASEGARPSLPWAMKINVNYPDASRQLDNLYYDSERFVTRSVANHLNDISKIDPSFVLDKLRQWQKEGKQNNVELSYIINHSLRTLVKKGHPETLQFLGYNLHPNIDVYDITFVKDTLGIGEKLSFMFDITSHENTKLMIDYIIYYPSNSSRRNKKIYKLKNMDCKKDSIYKVKGNRSFKEISTRKMKPGIHEIEIQINGTVYLSKLFTLTK